jgi:exonuclease SbcD
MMAHMYAKGAEIALKDASEKIVVGGQEEVGLEEGEHPDYLTCGHIHKRQRVWGTTWARYTGSVLPMSFAEKDYTHGVDLILWEEGKLSVEQLVYTPQHKLCILPENDEELTPKKLEKLIHQKLKERTGEKLDENFDYVVLKVKQDKVNNDEIKELEDLVNSKNAVLCKIQKIVAQVELSTLGEGKRLASIDDILNRAPMDTLKEAFLIRHNAAMSEQQEAMLQDLLNGIKNETTD